MSYEIPATESANIPNEIASAAFHELTRGPYRPVTDEEIAQREALRAECEAQFREDFARHTAEIEAEATGKLTSLTEVRRQRKTATAQAIGQQAVSPAVQQRR